MHMITHGGDIELLYTLYSLLIYKPKNLRFEPSIRRRMGYALSSPRWKYRGRLPIGHN